MATDGMPNSGTAKGDKKAKASLVQRLKLDTYSLTVPAFDIDGHLVPETESAKKKPEKVCRELTHLLRRKFKLMSRDNARAVVDKLQLLQCVAMIDTSVKSCQKSKESTTHTVSVNLNFPFNS